MAGWTLFRLATGFLVLSFALFSDATSSVAAGFEEAQIVPDVIQQAPHFMVKVTYPSGAQVFQGNELTPTSVKDIPKVEWDADPNSKYVLCMTDPDAPSRSNPQFREWHHWLVGNIPGNDVSKGETLSEYISSAPPKDSGLHRYVFLIYKQPSDLEYHMDRLNNTSQEGRANFSIAKFANKYNLGDPLAGNFFVAQYDDYVPNVYKQLSG